MATRKKTTTAAGTKATAVLQLLDIREPWVAVWFDIDDDGDFRDSVVTERLVCWALTADGSVVGVAPASPSDEAAGLYLPELVDKNFQGYCLEENVGKFLRAWEEELDDGEDGDEDDDDEDDDS